MIIAATNNNAPPSPFNLHAQTWWDVLSGGGVKTLGPQILIMTIAYSGVMVVRNSLAFHKNN
ncbi:hypothetical protein JVT61DRAFT_9913 [Boletus reticuloceps]|uniref:Uncharacterized protein n=1 Tax=Boletus reticuloceps TaxID=495285 RepID=A0A8I2YFY4_9AGAM|nr:hypothetical protein JVT61DRAFT_9913 [Boletus reticuloceps]